ncbi:MAG: methylenetetrahydrofolate reductase, partial [Christensenellaceae bacterium]|nr:methylenetetrahydrofolate reductase [Christensenellaceae bacterium]
MIDFKTNKTLFSLELFPPKDSAGMISIYSAMGRFRAVMPDYISVTYGAGGSTNRATIDIATDIKNKFGIETVAHLTCAGSTTSNIDDALDRLKENGVCNILALRGDNPATPTDFKYATDLIAHIGIRGGFKVCAACYPEKHLESPNIEHDYDVLKMKADAGVTHFISQLFFKVSSFEKLLDGMAKRNIKVPVEAGIMPVTSAKQILRMTKLSGAIIPNDLKRLIRRFESDKDAMRCAGVNYAINEITQLLALNVDGIHLYAMNNPETVEKIYSSIYPLLVKSAPQRSEERRVGKECR